MYLKYSEIDRTGELSLYSIALLNQATETRHLVSEGKGQDKIEA